MSAAKKERNMSMQGFMKKATAAKSATAFITQYRQYMLTGEAAPAIIPILDKIDNGELMPTPGLNEIATAVMNHIIISEARKFEATLEERASGGGSQKPWIATIKDSKDNVCTRKNAKGEVENLIKGFDKASDADRWTDLRLFDGASDWYGQVEHTLSSVSQIVLRDDAIARILKQPKGAVSKSKPTSTSKLSFGVKVKEYHAHFSKG